MGTGPGDRIAGIEPANSLIIGDDEASGLIDIGLLTERRSVRREPIKPGPFQP